MAAIIAFSRPLNYLHHYYFWRRLGFNIKLIRLKPQKNPVVSTPRSS